jgi:hypothetical protein
LISVYASNCLRREEKRRDEKREEEMREGKRREERREEKTEEKRGEGRGEEKRGEGRGEERRREEKLNHSNLHSFLIRGVTLHHSHVLQSKISSIS